MSEPVLWLDQLEAAEKAGAMGHVDADCFDPDCPQCFRVRPPVSAAPGSLMAGFARALDGLDERGSAA